MKGRDAIAALKKKLRKSTDQALADQIGSSVPSIQAWKTRSSVTSRQLAELVYRANRAAARHTIRPVVEFFPIAKAESGGGANYKVFGAKDGTGKKHPYRAGLKDELALHNGVYVFFDSRGRAIYVGKARLQSLWKEINNAFNRDRGDVQKLKRVRHPARRQRYRTSNEKARQITDVAVPLHELAEYFSAYHVAVEMINDLESMLVRSFANDLLNIKMERFERQRTPRRVRRKA